MPGTAPARATPIAIPHELAVAWPPEAASEGRHNPRVQYGAAVVVLVIAILAAAFVLA